MRSMEWLNPDGEPSQAEKDLVEKVRVAAKAWADEATAHGLIIEIHVQISALDGPDDQTEVH